MHELLVHGLLHELLLHLLLLHWLLHWLKLHLHSRSLRGLGWWGWWGWSGRGGRMVFFFGLGLRGRALRGRVLRRRGGMLCMSIRRIHVRRHAIRRPAVWWVVAHWRIRHHVPRGRWRHGVAMASAWRTRVLMARVLVFGKVASSRICSRRGALGKGILSIGRKGILSIGGVCVVAKRNQLARRRLGAAAGEGIWEAWIRHQAWGVAVGGMLGNVAPASTGMARRVARAGRRGVWVVVVVILAVERVLVVDGLGPWPPRPACALQLAAAAAAAVAREARGRVWYGGCVARRGSVAV